jgi:acyl carrier protein
MDVKGTVLTFLSSKNHIPGDTEAEELACDYLAAGVLDSMGIVEMVTEFEDIFGIRFSPEDMQSDEFRTVGGLIGIVERRRTEVASAC